MKNRLLSIVGAGGLAVALSAAATMNDARAAEFKWAFSGDAQTLDPYGLSEIYTTGFQGNFYESLVRRGRNLGIEPALAESWERDGDTVWRFKLRAGVTFHNGNPFNADDVIFSFQRARGETSDVKAKIRSIAELKKVDDLTVEITTNGPSPTLLNEIADWYIMDQEWSVENGAEEAADVRKGSENYATRNANGTGPFMVVSREPDVRTVFEPNPNWWDKREHNVDKAIFTPIKSDATRVAALLSGEVDMIYPVPLQDAGRVDSSDQTKMLQGEEMRIIFFGFDQNRDELLYSNVKGKNPFKDRRVREAVYLSIDENAIADRIMEGAAKPTGSYIAPQVEGYDPSMEERPAYDLKRAKQLLTEAGYPDGFEVTLDCPNDRYVKDEDICVATATMLARVGIKTRVNAMTKTKYFGKVLDRDTSMYMMGWVPPTYDAHNVLYDFLGTKAEGGQGKWNMGDYSNPKLDALQQKIAMTVDADERRALIKEALRLAADDIAMIPLHQQTLAWGVRENVEVNQRADNVFELKTTKIK
ncbi:ABC transporter substrate-binding protein [Limibacillus halophilus]|uniref:Peptide/nickel transport system substrate-binding protein n=1 Tax=Limibacillus halophilus TaxID=1579333 RepID=A0A839STK5_9PROT|nr:ABC transporter substrate-binding protein [Limibacillus halophilus]MBB3064243.1 peptide/nickel transport system substrate-binding protein [Limibacillus halophilus]